MIARLTVQRGTLTEYPLAEKVPGGWQNGVTFYPDAEVSKVTPLELRTAYTPTDDEREAIIDALLDELGWEWDEVPEEHIPSSREILGDMADRALAVVAGLRRTVQGEPSAYRFDGESDPIATNPILRGVDLSLERLVRRDCFTERTLRILDELRAEVLGVSTPAEVREHYATNRENGRLQPAMDPEHHAERYSPDVMPDREDGGQ